MACLGRRFPRWRGWVWRGIKNGRLLALVASQFDVFVTGDRNLEFQQNVARLPIAVIVLDFRQKSADYADLRRLKPNEATSLPLTFFLQSAEICVICGPFATFAGGLLKARGTTLSDTLPLMPEVLRRLPSLLPGSVIEIAL